MLKKLHLSFFVLIVLSTVVVAQSGSKKYKVKSATGVNLRDRPNTNSNVVEKIGNGERLKVVEKTNNEWYKVEYNGKTGYVYAEYLDQGNDRSDRNRDERNSSSRNQGNNRSRSSGSSSSNRNSGSSVDYNWGIGLRLGDPTGLTIKKYLEKSALEFSIGRGYMFYGDRYYHRGFDRRYDHYYYNHPHYERFEYRYYSASFPLAVQLHYVFQNNFAGVDNLYWYAGFGGQFRYQSYTYHYRYKYWGNPYWYEGSESYTDIDIGVDGVFGMEFFIPRSNISVFADVTIFTELADSFQFWPMGGIGGRFNFK
ncbi:MAG: SH3 domain-containing protein [Cytophagaceae bacterium]